MEKLTPEAGRVEEKRKLYVFLNHNFGDPCIHTLYVLQIPNPNDPSPEDGEVEEEKSRLSPNLSFPQPHYGRDMCCVNLDSKLYFIGGASRDLITGKPIYRRDVFILDTAAAGGVPPPGTPPERNSEFQAVGPNMTTGKIGAVAAFVADGNIFVLSGLRRPGFHSFEMFTPDSSGAGGKWDILAPPIFKHNLHAHVVANGKLFVSCNNDVSLYIFDLSSKQWNKVDQPPIFLGAASVILDNNNKLYCCSNPFSPLVMCQALEFSAHNKGVPLCVGDNVVAYNARYILQSLYPSAYLIYIGNGHLCFLQVGCAPDPFNDEVGYYDPEKCYLHLSLFDSSTNDEYPIAAAHFTVNPFEAITKVAAAMAV